MRSSFVVEFMVVSRTSKYPPVIEPVLPPAHHAHVSVSNPCEIIISRVVFVSSNIRFQHDQILRHRASIPAFPSCSHIGVVSL